MTRWADPSAGQFQKISRRGSKICTVDSYYPRFGNDLKSHLVWPPAKVGILGIAIFCPGRWTSSLRFKISSRPGSTFKGGLSSAQQLLHSEHSWKCFLKLLFPVIWVYLFAFLPSGQRWNTFAQKYSKMAIYCFSVLSRLLPEENIHSCLSLISWILTGDVSEVTPFFPAVVIRVLSKNKR